MKTQIDIKFPIVTITYGDTVTDADVAMVNRILSEILLRRQPFAFICDMQAGSPNKSQGGVIKDFVDERRDDFRNLAVLNVLVITSKPLRAVINAVGLLIKPPYPSLIKETLEDAKQACDSALAERRRMNDELVLKMGARALQR